MWAKNLRRCINIINYEYNNCDKRNMGLLNQERPNQGDKLMSPSARK